MHGCRHAGRLSVLTVRWRRCGPGSLQQIGFSPGIVEEVERQGHEVLSGYLPTCPVVGSDPYFSVLILACRFRSDDDVAGMYDKGDTSGFV